MRRIPHAAPVLALAFAAQPVLAQQTAENAPENVIITAGALLGTAVDPEKIPVNTQTVTGADLAKFGPPDLLNALATDASGVNFANAQDNPFQPNLFYRGFEASPLAGDAQGLAIYANGVRMNQPFGDTLNWDLIPDVAIDSLTLEGSNPVFGLNALGGSVAIRFKNGFTYTGIEGEAMGGSFGRYQGSVQLGVSGDNWSLYLAQNILHEDGWREHSPSSLDQIFVDAGVKAEGLELHLNLIGASNDLTGNGSTPVELLAVKRNAVFTFPDETRNTYGLANIYGTRRVSEALSFQGNVYVSHLRQRTQNGDASDVDPCGANLCLDGDEVTDVHGNTIPDFLNGGDYAQLNSTTTATTGYGGAIQMALDAMLGGHMNTFLAGFAFDGGHTNFSAQSEIGELGDDRGFVGPGIVIDQADGSIAPVQVASDNRYYGIYAADILDLTDALSLNLSARYNVATIDLHDKLGVALNGSHSYSHFNPAAGLTYKAWQGLSLYAGYAEANRAPTPAEFSCADPSAPCSLTNFFVGDPDLKQVIAHTIEAGLRGDSTIASGQHIRWHAGVFRTDADDDILFVASPIIGRAFFENIGDTRRQGIETSLDVLAETWSVSLDYSYTDATFRSFLTLNSPENPLADANGQIQVSPGDRLPNVPEHLFKATAVYEPIRDWTIAFAARAASGVFLQGDESNLNPTTGSYWVFDLGSQYQLTEHLSVFASITNLFDANYATFGTFSPTADVPIAEAPGASDPRSLSPAPPRAFFAGVRMRM